MAILGQSMSPVPDPLDFDPSQPGGFVAPLPGPVVLGQAPPPPAPAPAAPAGRTGLDYYTFGMAGDIRRGLERVGSAVMGLPSTPAAPAPRGTSAGGIGLGVLPVDKLPAQSFTGIGTQYFPQAPAGAPGDAAEAPPAGAVPAAAAAAPAPAAAPQTRAMARPGAAARAPVVGAAPTSELGKIAYGLRSAELAAASSAFNRAGEEQAAQVQTLEQAQQAEREAQAERADLASQQAEQARIEEENAAIERERRRQLVEETTQKLDAANRALDESKIDIEAAYGGAAGRIFAGLAVALGSFGASLTGGPNYAMQLVNQRIDREIDAQKTELEKKKGKVNQLGQLLQRNEALLGDADQARRLAKAQTFKALADDVEARAKGRAMAPQQAQVLQTLRSQQAQAMSELELGVERATAARQMVGAEERARMAAAAGAARAQAAKDARELQMFADKEAIKATFANRGPEAAAKLADQTSQLATKLIDKDFSAAAGNYLDIASQVGIDPMTGKSTGKDPRGLGLVNLGILTPEGRINRQATDALAERMAKSFGGVVTESDREAARKLLKGAGTVEDIQRGIFAYGQAIGRNMRTLQAGNPVAYDTMAERMPLLREAASIGQARDVQRAAGFQAVR